MKHSKKMVLVDYDEAVHGKSSNVFDVHSNQKFDLSHPESSYDNDEVNDIILKELDSKFLKILQDKRLNNSDKIRVHNDLLRRFLLDKSDRIKRKQK